MAAVIALEGEIDLHHSVFVREKLEPHIAAKEAKVVVDLSGVSYLDSSGLAVFIEAMQRVSSYGGVFALCGLRESVRHIFAIARLDQVFRIFPDQAAASAE
ncbi:MAG: STAS domain-containing protein [Chthoniobacteraceae bacterium]